MAKLDEQLLGKVSGKLGNLVYRNINGKTFISVRPPKYNVTNTKESRKVKKGFKNLIAFASFVNKIPELKKVWSKREVKGVRAYNKIFSHNSSFVKAEFIDTFFKIIPDPRNDNHLLSKLNYEEGTLILELIDNTKPEAGKQKTYILVSIVYACKKNKFSFQTTELKEAMAGKTSLITVQLNKENLALLNKHNGINIYCGLVVLNPDESVSGWSNSISKKLT